MVKSTMLAVVKDKKAPGVTLKHVPIPKPKKDEVLVKVKLASICGTDIGIYDWNLWAQEHISPPNIIGHEIVGEVIKINGSNNPQNIKVGDLVSSETHIFCGKCYQCKKGNMHICEKLKLFGISRNGSFAQYATIPLKTTWKNNKSIPIVEMSSQEPFGNAVHAVSDADVKDKVVAIMGLGPTGLCAIAAAKAYGAKKIIGINRGEYRRNLGREMGADEVYRKLPKKYYGKVDIFLEMSGAEKAIEEVFNFVAIAGKVIIFGIPKEKIDLDFGRYIIDKELTIKGIFGRKIWDTWEKVSDLLIKKRVNLSKIVTHEFPLHEFEKAVKVMKSGKCGKILLIP